MKEKIRKISAVKITLIFFSLFFLLFLLLFFVLPITLLEMVSDTFIGPKITAKNISYKDGKAHLEKVKIIGDDGVVMLDSPSVDIDYSISKLRIEKISVDGGELNVTLFGDNKTNVVYEFDKSPSKKYKDLSEYKAKSKVPIDKIVAKNLNVNFIDTVSNKNTTIEGTNFNAEINFSKLKGVEVKAQGIVNGADAKYYFSNEKEPYYMRIYANDVNFDKDIAKEILNVEDMSYEGGKADVDLVISWSGLFGNAKLENLKAKHKYLDEYINIKLATATFDKNDIVFNSKVNLFEKNIDINGKYKDNILNLPIKIDNIDKKYIKTISFFDKLNVEKISNFNIFSDIRIDKDKVLLIDNFIQFKEESELSNIKFKDLNINLETKDKYLRVYSKNINLGIFDNKQEINFDLVKNVHKGEDEFSLNLNLEPEEKNNLIPKIELNSNFSNEKGLFNGSVFSNVLDFDFKYNTKENILDIFKKGKFQVIYNIAENKFLDSNGNVKLKLEENNPKLEFDIKENVVNFKNISILNDNKKIISGNGIYDNNNKKLNLNLVGNNFKIEKKYNGEDVRVNFNGIVSLNVEDNKIDLSGDFKDTSVEYIASIKNLNGKVKIDGIKNTVDFKARANLAYKNFHFNDIDLDFDINENKINVNKLGNDKIKFYGDAQKRLNFEIKNLDNKDLDFKDVDFKIKDLKGYVENFENPKAQIDVNDVNIKINDNKKLMLNGNLNFHENILYLKKINIDKNILSGEYNLNNKKYNAILNLNEANVFSFISNNKFKYSLLGKVEITGDDKHLFSNFQAKLESPKEEKNKIPKIDLTGRYVADDSLKGILKFDNIDIKNEKNVSVLDFDAIVDLKNNTISSDINKKINTFLLAEYIGAKNDEVKGTLNLKAKLHGTFEKPLYNAEIFSNHLEIKDVKLDKIYANLLGDINEVKLEDFNFTYLDNNLRSSGKYNLKDSTYAINVNSDVIDLGFLKAFDSMNIVDNIGGKANFNINLTNKGSNGYVRVNFFNMISDKYKIYLKDFSTRLRFLGNSLEVQKFKGKFNDGDINIDGFIDFPRIDNENIKHLYDDINYNFTLRANNIHYIYPDVVDFKVDSRLDISKKNLIGDIQIKESKVKDIPNTKKDLLTILKNILFRSATREEDKKEKEDKEKARQFLDKLMPINVVINLNDPMDINIDNYNVVVGEIRGKLNGRINLLGEKGKYTALGDVEFLNGNVIVNNNNFYFDRALAVFNDRNTYLPNLNPNIFVDSFVDLQGDNIGFNINGKLNNLRFTLDSKEGRSSGSISQLLSNDIKDGSGNAAYLKLLKNMAEGQVVQTIVGPFTRFVKKVFNFSKFKVSSNVDISTIGQNYGTFKLESNNDIKLGTVLEMERNLFNENLFITSKVKLFTLSKGFFSIDKSDSGNIREYDINLEYRYGDGKVLGVGVGSVPTQNQNKQFDEMNKDKESKTNFHIDFKFRKKLDSFADIFNF